MTLVTTDGHCGKIRIGLAVTNGRIQATSGKFVFRKIQLAGRISGNGQALINGVAGPREAQGTGRFVGARGQGKWSGTGPSGVCSGFWVANRA